jgi:signal transduction histidine kinase
VAGSDVLPAFDTVAADSLRHESQAFHEFLPTPSGPVEIIMTRGGIGAVDIVEWFAEVGSEVLPAFVVILVGSLLVIAVGIRRDLKPLLRIAAAAERIGPSDIASRLDESDVPVEILPLVRAVNGALGRLDAAFASQRQFTADAAHELRTPIAVLRARVDALPENSTSRALRKDLDRLGRLAEQLLTVSVLDSRAFDLDADVDVGAVTRGVVAELAPLAVARERNLAFEGPDRPVYVSGNVSALEEGVRNLIENALRHTPYGEVVDVAVRDNGTIEVMDRGPGVPLHHREMIFRRFWRGAAAGHQGAGLGLPIVRHIAEAHGGSVHVASREEGGAVFRIELPMRGTSSAPAKVARLSS